ncbi:MAG TPA: hypothetical protein VHD91_12390 [Gaiellaceae bacterium]|jgi:hypothetical protein|nr:hypothetical protein [Gaiellaceae bacterium]
MPAREAWLAVVQRGDGEHEQETEAVTLTGVQALEGGTIETTDGLRITLVEPATIAKERP